MLTQCAQYIGEIARYLLATPESEADKTHGVRLLFGNGLRPQVWADFVRRFGIGEIAEFYGATEGNANVVNIENKVGAVGCVPVALPAWVLDRLLPLAIIRVDKDTYEPVRDENGLCVRAEPGGRNSSFDLSQH